MTTVKDVLVKIYLGSVRKETKMTIMIFTKNKSQQLIKWVSFVLLPVIPRYFRSDTLTLPVLPVISPTKFLNF